MKKKYEDPSKIEYFFEAPVTFSDGTSKKYEFKTGVFTFGKGSEDLSFDKDCTDLQLLADNRLKIKIQSKLIKIARSAKPFPEIIDILYC